MNDQKQFEASSSYAIFTLYSGFIYDGNYMLEWLLLTVYQYIAGDLDFAFADIYKFNSSTTPLPSKAQRY